MARGDPPAQPSGSGKAKGGIAAAIAVVLASVYAVEGGYVNNRDDPGGPTNYGVTQQVARQSGYTGDMRDFPKHCDAALGKTACADQIYIDRYIKAPGYMPFFYVEPAIAAELVDTAVNMGPPRPSRWLQESLNSLDGAGLKTDGRIGPATVAAYVHFQRKAGDVQACVQTLNALDGKQLAEYQRLVRVNPNLQQFYKGWVRLRINNVDRRRCGKGHP